MAPSRLNAVAMRGVRILSVAMSSAITAQAHAAEGPNSAAASVATINADDADARPSIGTVKSPAAMCRDAEDWAKSCRAGTIEMRLHDGKRRTTSKS